MLIFTLFSKVTLFPIPQNVKQSQELGSSSARLLQEEDGVKDHSVTRNVWLMLLLSVVSFLLCFGVLFFLLRKRFLSGKYTTKPAVSPEIMAKSIQSLHEITSSRFHDVEELDKYKFDDQESELKKKTKLNIVHLEEKHKEDSLMDAEAVNEVKTNRFKPK